MLTANDQDIEEEVWCAYGEMVKEQTQGATIKWEDGEAVVVEQSGRRLYARELPGRGAWGSGWRFYDSPV